MIFLIINICNLRRTIEYLDFEETNINGSYGLAHYNDFDEWLEIVLSIEKYKLCNNVHTSTLFSVRKSDNRINGKQ